MIRRLAVEEGAERFLAQATQSGAAHEIMVLGVPSAPETLATVRDRAKAILDAGQVAHPALARVVDTGIASDGRLYVATERTPGVPLQELLDAHGAIGARRAIHITLLAAEALEAAHAAGIVHGELTPAQIRVAPSAGERRETVVVTGLGVRPPRGADGAPLPVGKRDRPYAAPERAAGAPADTRSDVFSLASITLAALSGTPPPIVRPTGLTENGATRQAGPDAGHDAVGSPTRPSVLHVLLRARSPLPARRYQTVAVFRDALEAASAGMWTAAAPASAAAAERAAPDGSAVVVAVTPAASAVGPVPRANVSNDAASSAITDMVAVQPPAVEPAASAGRAAPIAPAKRATVWRRRRAGLGALAAAAVITMALAIRATRVPVASTGGEDGASAAGDGAAPSVAAGAPVPLPPALVPPPATPPSSASAASPRPRAVVSSAPDRSTTAAPPLRAADASPAPRRSGPTRQPSRARADRALSAAAREATPPRTASTITPPAALAAAPPPPRAASAVPVSASAAASIREGVDAVVERYARAIEARDLAALRRAYPGMTAAQQRAWANFFASVRDLRTRLVVAEVRGAGREVIAEVRGSYEYQNRRPSRTERSPVSFRATLTHGSAGWQLDEVR